MTEMRHTDKFRAKSGMAFTVVCRVVAIHNVLHKKIVHAVGFALHATPVLRHEMARKVVNDARQQTRVCPPVLLTVYRSCCLRKGP